MMESEEFGISYNVKDLILYALAIGFGTTTEEGNSNNNENELKYLYERHPNFVPAQTFCLVLQFWAGNQGYATTSGLPQFPPPAMTTKNGIIPRNFLKGDLDISGCPIIHSWQSIVWHHNLPVPTISNSRRNDQVIQTKLCMRTVDVTPKSVGTFVTTETIVTLVKDTFVPPTICTMQSTALVLGAPKDQIIPYHTERTANLISRPQIPKDTTPILQMTFRVQPNQALVYRLASGDTNHIHVDTSAAKMLGSDKKSPLLHGLCTLGIAYRAITSLINTSIGETIQKLEGRFTKPVFINDVLCTKIWSDGTFQQDCTSKKSNSRRYLFVVSNVESGETVVNAGIAVIVSSEGTGPQNQLSNRSRL